MDSCLQGIFLPNLKIRFHINPADPIQCHNIKFPHRFVVFRRIPCCRNDPSLRDSVTAKAFSLQKLQHRRRQSLRNTVDLIDEQNPLRQTCLTDFIIDRRHNLAHRIFRGTVFPPAEHFLLNKRQADSALTGMMRDSIGHQPDLAFLRYLLHDLGLTHSGRPDQEDRPLTDRRHYIIPIIILHQISPDAVLNFLFRSFDVHNFLSPAFSFAAVAADFPCFSFVAAPAGFPYGSFADSGADPVSCPGSSISFIAQGGTEMSVY